MLSLLLLVVGCAPDPVGEGLLGEGWANPFPSQHHVVDGQVSLLLDELPVGGPTPLPVERLRARAGFSPAQTAVVRLDGVNAAALPTWRAPTPGEGGVQLWDLTAGAPLPVMAELDANDPSDRPGLLIRPLTTLTPGHQIAVVVTTEAAPRPAVVDALLGRRAPEGAEEAAALTQATFTQLAALGVSNDTIAVAWDFPVSAGDTLLRDALVYATPTGEFSFDEVREVGDVPPRTYRAAEGELLVPDLLVDDLWLNLDAAGGLSPTGEVGAHLYVHIPESVRDAPEGTVPVMIFGHGIFSEPSAYLDDEEDKNGVIRLADELGVILIATRWRGLTTPDIAGALAVANDFGRLPSLPDRLVQGQVNTRALAELALEGALFDDPVFLGESGQSLPLRGRLVYYGISLGGIEGAVFVAGGGPVSAAVLHVGGGTWSTMLERSSNWPIFESLLVEVVEDPWDRQVLFALSQLWWDPADPMSSATSLTAGPPVLLQESLGDEQVPNLTTRSLARAAGLRQQEPVVEAVWGLDTIITPTRPGFSAYMQYDPERPLPPDTNQPAPVTDAHTIPRVWAEHRETVSAFVARYTEGSLVSACEELPCSASNSAE
ncbi:hypothetical protein L6R49_24670 [Myxococcota bacterium]|nr:hypothetical protein [Myxococcota bacterium]